MRATLIVLVLLCSLAYMAYAAGVYSDCQRRSCAAGRHPVTVKTAVGSFDCVCAED